MILGISLDNHITNDVIRRGAKVDAVFTAVARAKSTLAGQVTLWRSRMHKRSIRKPQRRWIVDSNRTTKQKNMKKPCGGLHPGVDFKELIKKKDILYYA